jgi:hypothetical protein
MNVKLLFGVALFVIGLITAAIGIVGVGMPVGPETTIASEQNESSFGATVRTAAIPLIAGLSLAVGGLLMGLSMGNWKHPRTHPVPSDKLVNPEGYHDMKHV